MLTSLTTWLVSSSLNVNLKLKSPLTAAKTFSELTINIANVRHKTRIFLILFFITFFPSFLNFEYKSLSYVPPLFIQIFAKIVFLPVKTTFTISKAIQCVETIIFAKWLLTLTSFPRGYTANISSCVYYLVFTLRHIHTVFVYVLDFKMSIDCVLILRLSVFFLINILRFCSLWRTVNYFIIKPTLF